VPAEISWNAKITVAGVDLSARLQEIRFNRTREAIDATASGDLAHVSLGGLESWSLVAKFIQDYAVGMVHRTLDPLVGSAGFTVMYKKDGTIPESDTNPQYSGTAILEGYNPVDATMGQLSTVSVTFRSAGDLTRDIIP
jgi:hypothetical protein